MRSGSKGIIAAVIIGALSTLMSVTAFGGQIRQGQMGPQNSGQRFQTMGSARGDIVQNNMQGQPAGLQDSTFDEGAGQPSGMNVDSPVNGTIVQDRKNNLFNGKGISGMELPVPTGAEGVKPSVDREKFDEAVEEGGYSQSDDYSYVYTMGNVSESEYDTFCEYISDIDSAESNVLSRLSSEGWKIILTTADLNELLFNGQSSGVVGCTCTAEKEIFISAGEYSYCIYHELGHYIDCTLGWRSATEEFKSIYDSEAANLTAYGQTSAEEFFAEVHMYMFMDADNLSAKCPNAYEYLQDCISAIQ